MPNHVFFQRNNFQKHGNLWRSFSSCWISSLKSSSVRQAIIYYIYTHTEREIRNSNDRSIFFLSGRYSCDEQAEFSRRKFLHKRCRFWIGRVLFTIWSRVAKHLSCPLPPTTPLSCFLNQPMVNYVIEFCVVFQTVLLMPVKKRNALWPPHFIIFLFSLESRCSGWATSFASATAGRMYRYESINYRIVNQNHKMFL